MTPRDITGHDPGDEDDSDTAIYRFARQHGYELHVCVVAAENEPPRHVLVMTLPKTVPTWQPLDYSVGLL